MQVTIVFRLSASCTELSEVGVLRIYLGGGSRPVEGYEHCSSMEGRYSLIARWSAYWMKFPEGKIFS